MFDRLSKDLIQQVFEYDSTYHEVYKYVMECLVPPKMKVLQHFLGTYDGPEMVMMGKQWQVMKPLSFGDNREYIEITWCDVVKTMFYVLTPTEKRNLDVSMDVKSPMIIQSNLYRLDPVHIAYFIGCAPQTVERIQKNFCNEHMTNTILYDLLGEEYPAYVQSLKDHEVYDECVHRYLFEEFMFVRNEYYFHSDCFNYHCFVDEEDDDNIYYIYWNILTTQIELNM